jgi:DNA-binding GntR family transcriptional regulator
MKKLKPLQLTKDRVFDELKKAIINNTLLPGTKLKEEDIARTLGVSRTPVREAINRLALEGFVKLIPQRGAYVATATQKDVEEIFLLRESLEGLAARLAAPRITDAIMEKLKTCLQGFSEIEDELELFHLHSKKNAILHQTILQASGSERLLRIASDLFDYSQSFLLSPVGFAQRFRVYQAQHHEIIAALQARNSTLAEELMSAHISRVRDGVLNNIEVFLKPHYQATG